MIEYVLENLSILTHFGDVSYTIRVDQRAPFFSEKTILTSIFQNIMENAIKFRDTEAQPSLLKSQTKRGYHLFKSPNPFVMWQEENKHLVKSFTFKDFKEAFGFITKVALVSEKLNHHPEWTNSWNKVDVRITTHSAGNTVTDKDHELAREIDLLA